MAFVLERSAFNRLEPLKSRLYRRFVDGLREGILSQLAFAPVLARQTSARQIQRFSGRTRAITIT
jgi:predicted acyltransferase